MILHSKRHFGDVIKAKDLEMGRAWGVLRGFYVVKMVLTRCRKSEPGEVTTKVSILVKE